MEESENRKLRLKAMRMEAADAEASPNVDSSAVSAHLSNPLAEPSASSLALEDPPVAARFDFYTDPMAAFSGNRRKTQRTNQNSPNCFSPPTSSASPGPGNMNMTPSPSHQYNQSHSSDQRMYGTPVPYHTSGPWRSPIESASPFPQQVGTPPAIWNRPDCTAGYGFPTNSPIVGGFPPNSPMVGSFASPGFGLGGSPNPNPNPNPSHGRGSGYQFNNSPASFRPVGSPSYNTGRGSRPQFDNSPKPGFGQGGSPSYNTGRSSRPQFDNSPNPGFGLGGSPSYNTGRSSRPQFNNNPNPGFGQGGSPNPNTGNSSGHRFSSSPSPSPGSGRGRGRGRGFHGSVSARERPEMFFHRSMLEDPWRLLKPVVRKVPAEDAWLPKSIRKGAVSQSSSGFRSSGLSLAETLAASYEEAAALAAAYEETAAANDVKDSCC